MPKEKTKQLTLADIIEQKIKEAESKMLVDNQNLQQHQPSRGRMDPKVVTVYKNVGKLLSTYKSGKLPKAFKLIPAVSDWEELLFLTNPDEWTPHAMLAGLAEKKKIQIFY